MYTYLNVYIYIYMYIRAPVGVNRFVRGWLNSVSPPRTSDEAKRRLTDNTQSPDKKLGTSI